MRIRQRAALVERPVACAGKGQYYALVYYGSPGGDLHHQVFEYGRRDPREKEELTVLRNIMQTIPKRYRKFTIAVSVVKRCLHPKAAKIPKVDRKPYFERVFSWVLRHENTQSHSPGQALQQLLHNDDRHAIQTVTLPYTKYELHRLAVKEVVTTSYWPHAYANVGIRGVERTVELTSIM